MAPGVEHESSEQAVGATDPLELGCDLVDYERFQERATTVVLHAPWVGSDECTFPPTADVISATFKRHYPPTGPFST